MNSIVIFLMPVEATRRDFAAAIQEIHGASDISEATKAKAATQSPKVADNDQMPLWTWFVSDPRP